MQIREANIMEVNISMSDQIRTSTLSPGEMCQYENRNAGKRSNRGCE